MKEKIKVWGSQGVWTVKVDTGKKVYPAMGVLHRMRMNKNDDGLHYDDHVRDFTGPHHKTKYDGLIAALTNPENDGYVIVQSGKIDENGNETRRRDKYIGLYKVEDVKDNGGAGVYLKFVKREPVLLITQKF